MSLAWSTFIYLCCDELKVMFKKILFITLFILVPFVPIWKVWNAGILSYIDNDFSYNLTHTLYSYLFVWNPGNNGTYTSITNLIYEIIFSFEFITTRVLHLSSSFASTLMIYIPLLIYLFGLYKIIDYIVLEGKNHHKGINFFALYFSILAFFQLAR